MYRQSDGANHGTGYTSFKFSKCLTLVYIIYIHVYIYILMRWDAFTKDRPQPRYQPYSILHGLELHQRFFELVPEL